MVSSTSHAPKDPWDCYIYLHERLIFMGFSCRYIYRSSHGSSGYFNLSSTFQNFFGSLLSSWKPGHCDEDSRCLTWGTWGTFKAPNRTWTFNKKNDVAGRKHIHRYIYWIYVVSFSDFRSFHWIKFFKHERSFSKNPLQNHKKQRQGECLCIVKCPKIHLQADRSCFFGFLQGLEKTVLENGGLVFVHQVSLKYPETGSITLVSQKVYHWSPINLQNAWRRLGLPLIQPGTWKQQHHATWVCFKIKSEPSKRPVHDSS